jgi:hypothetical protein
MPTFWETFIQGNRCGAWNIMTQREEGPSTFLSSKCIVPSVGRFKPGDDMQQGRLPATGAADDGQRLAARGLQLQVAERGLAARTVAVAQTLDVDVYTAN